MLLPSVDAGDLSGRSAMFHGTPGMFLETRLPRVENRDEEVALEDAAQAGHPGTALQLHAIHLPPHLSRDR